MSVALWIAVAAMAALPLAADALEKARQDGPSDHVPATLAVHYVSPFHSYRPAAADRGWRAMNAEMARLSDHMGQTTGTTSPGQNEVE